MADVKPIAVARELTACIFDVDGVLLASPHERAWRDAIAGYANPARFTTAIYQADVAGLPRLAGARAALEALDVVDAVGKALAYARHKQARLEDLIASGGIRAFADALRFVETLHTLHWPMAVASSSKNAREMLSHIRLPSGIGLLEAFGASVCGRDLAHGKPDPEIFLLAARELNVDPARCVVIEDAPAGIEAARAGIMRSVGVARVGDAKSLVSAGANLVVTSLDDVDIAALRDGRLARRAL